MHGVANHAEQLVDRFLIGDLLLDLRLVERPQQEITHLVARPELELGRRLEFHAERFLDLGDVRCDFVGVGALAGCALPRQAATGSANSSDDHIRFMSCRFPTRPSVPAIRPTTRAIRGRE